MNIFKKLFSKSFDKKLANVKNIFRKSYEQAMELNKQISEDIATKQIEITAIQSQIDFNKQVAEDNSNYIAKLKELIS